MAIFLKKGKSESEIQENDIKVQEAVTGIIRKIREKGDKAVRELSEKFDKWSPENFRLSDSEIAAVVSSVPARVVEDIKFAQAQIRFFAEKQKRDQSTT